MIRPHRRHEIIPELPGTVFRLDLRDFEPLSAWR
jgi:hypothetical protein